MCPDKFSQIIIFTKIDIDSLLLFWEAYEYLKSQFLYIIVFPVSNNDEILKICSDFYKFTKDLIFLLIDGEKNLHLKKKNLEKKVTRFPHINLKMSVDTDLTFREHNFFEQLPSKEQHYNQKMLKVKTIDIADFFKNWNSTNFLKIMNYKNLSIVDAQNDIWINAVITFHLHLTKNLSFYQCLSRLKKNSRMLECFLGKQKHLKIHASHHRLIFSRELPFYFLYHCSIFESFLNTPSISIGFETWKKDGFPKILQFLGRVSIFKEDVGKSWIKYTDGKKKEIIHRFKIEIKKFGIFRNIIYNFKKSFKNIKALTNLSSLDLALTLRSMFDFKIRNLVKKIKKKVFWISFECLLNLKYIKRFLIKEKYVQQFISRVSRIVLSKKTFLSRKTMRILYISGSNDITYEMLKGLLKILISVFNKNKLVQKLLLLIIKEKNTTTIFISHQNKIDFIMYCKFLTSNSLIEVFKSVKKEKNIVVIKFSPVYELEILSNLSKINIKNINTLFK